MHISIIKKQNSDSMDKFYTSDLYGPQFHLKFGLFISYFHIRFLWFLWQKYIEQIHRALHPFWHEVTGGALNCVTRAHI